MNYIITMGCSHVKLKNMKVTEIVAYAPCDWRLKGKHTNSRKDLENSPKMEYVGMLMERFLWVLAV